MEEKAALLGDADIKLPETGKPSLSTMTLPLTPISTPVSPHRCLPSGAAVEEAGSPYLQKAYTPSESPYSSPDRWMTQHNSQSPFLSPKSSHKCSLSTSASTPSIHGFRTQPENSQLAQRVQDLQSIVLKQQLQIGGLESAQKSFDEDIRDAIDNLCSRLRALESMPSKENHEFGYLSQAPTLGMQQQEQLQQGVGIADTSSCMNTEQDMMIQQLLSGGASIDYHVGQICPAGIMQGVEPDLPMHPQDVSSQEDSLHREGIEPMAQQVKALAWRVEELEAKIGFDVHYSLDWETELKERIQLFKKDDRLHGIGKGGDKFALTFAGTSLRVEPSPEASAFPLSIVKVHVDRRISKHAKVINDLWEQMQDMDENSKSLSEEIKRVALQTIKSTCDLTLVKVDKEFSGSGAVSLASAPYKKCIKILDKLQKDATDAKQWLFHPDRDFHLLGVGSYDSANWVYGWTQVAELAGRKQGTAYFLQHFSGRYDGSQQEGEYKAATKIPGLNIIKVYYDDDGNEVNERQLM